MWQIAKAKSPREAVKLLDSIVSKTATEYIKKTRWSDAYWPKGVPRFNTYTSNAVECVNSIFREIRKGSLLTVMQDTRRWTTNTLAKRKDLKPAILQPESPVPSVEKHIREQVADASLWEVTQVNKKGLWELRQSLASKTVRLIDGCLTCDCYDFRKSNLPCAHTTKVLMHLGLSETSTVTCSNCNTKGHSSRGCKRPRKVIPESSELKRPKVE